VQLILLVREQDKEQRWTNRLQTFWFAATSPQETVHNVLTACPATGQILGVPVGSRLLLLTGFHVPSPCLPEVAHAESKLNVLELLWKWCGVKKLSNEVCFFHCMLIYVLHYIIILHRCMHMHAYATCVCVLACVGVIVHVWVWLCVRAHWQFSPCNNDHMWLVKGRLWSRPCWFGFLQHV